MTSVCSISTSVDRFELRWKKNGGDDIKGFIYFTVTSLFWTIGPKDPFGVCWVAPDTS
jgi:hypothetical protein